MHAIRRLRYIYEVCSYDLHVYTCKPRVFVRWRPMCTYSSPTAIPNSKKKGSCLDMVTSHVQWSEDKLKADPFFGRSRVRFRVPPWGSNTIAGDNLA